MALIAVLWIVAALSLLVIGVSDTVRQQTRSVGAERDQITGQALGEAAIALALQQLQATPERPRGIVTATAPYAGVPFEVEVAPLNGLISLNGAPPELLASLLQVEDPLFQPIERLQTILIDLRLQHAAAGIGRGSIGSALQPGKFDRAKALGERLAGLHIGIELHDGLLGFLMQVVQKRDITTQDILMAIKLETDAIDLAGHVLELFLETLQLRPERGEHPRQETLVLKRGRIELLRLDDDIGQKLADFAEIAIAHLAQDAVGIVGNGLLGTVAIDGNAGAVGQVDAVADASDLRRIGDGDRQAIAGTGGDIGIAHKSCFPVHEHGADRKNYQPPPRRSFPRAPHYNS